MVEVGTWSLPVKVHPEKTAIQKNSTAIDREFDSLSITVEFYRPPDFFFRCTFTGKLLLANSIKATVRRKRPPREGKLSNPRGARRAGCMHGENLRNPVRERLAGAMRQFPSSQLDSIKLIAMIS